MALPSFFVSRLADRRRRALDGRSYAAAVIVRCALVGAHPVACCAGAATALLPIAAAAQAASVSAMTIPAGVGSSPAAPADTVRQQDGETIRQAAIQFLQHQATGLPGKVEIKVAPAFPRGLPACTNLDPFMPPNTRLWGRMTVGVRCSGEHPWTLYLQATITVHAPYYVAGRAINSGEVLSAADLVAHDGDLTKLPQTVITDPSQAVGAIALTRVTAGFPLRQDMLRSQSEVIVGQTVRVVAQGQDFAISSEGSAMNNAGPGQQVRVRTAGGQIITGIVRNDSTVELQM